MELINFTNLPHRKKSYGGANGNKLSIVFNNELYMLKLPSHAIKNPNMSYVNSCVSEYLGCHIFNLLGVEAQKTILGYYEYNNIKRIAVCCMDFEKYGFKLIDFASVKNQIIDSKSNGYGTDIDDILETIEKQTLIDPIILKEHFFNVFVIDAFIGNWDRHNGNWGFLYNQETDSIKIAPIFDCGSCLFPQMDELLIERVLNNNSEFNARIYDYPTSSILKNGKRINYYNFINSHEYKECDKAINRLKSKVDLNSINNLINEIPCISNNQKEFLILILKKKYETFFN